MQIFLVDETISVLVDHVERLFKLLNLRLIKHSKDIGGGSLRALLGGLSLGTFARHGGVWIWTCAHIRKLDKSVVTPKDIIQRESSLFFFLFFFFTANEL